MKTTIALAAIALATIAPAAANAASSFYIDESAWRAAIGSAVVSVQDFEGTPTAQTTTSVTYGNATFSCSGTTYCPGFFGVRTDSGGSDGPTTVYGATPDTLIFSFAQPITAFGIDALGLGSVGATDVTVTLSNGSSQVVLTNFVDEGAQFIGVYDAMGIVSVSFNASTPYDGIDFDRLQTSLLVPEPASLGLMLAGLATIGAVSRRRGGKA